MKGFDSRAQVCKEWTGELTARWVVRFGGVWVKSFITSVEAMEFARDEGNKEMMIQIYYEYNRKNNRKNNS